MELAAQGYDREQVMRWSRAIRSVRLRGVLGRGRVHFEPAPIHAPNAPQERRFIALLLMILAECRVNPRSRDVRAWTQFLWRGRRDREVITPDGELKRRYVPAVRHGTSGHQGGLAARLGCSVKEVDRYLDVAIAAGFVRVWQVKKDVPTSKRGKEHAYATFRWLGAIPAALWRRLSGQEPAADKQAPRAHTAGPSRPPSEDSVSFFERLNERFLGPPLPD